MRLFRPLFRRHGARAIDAALRRLATVSGPARDRDVAAALSREGPASGIGPEHRRLQRFLVSRKFQRFLSHAEVQHLALSAIGCDRSPTFAALVERRHSALYEKLVALRPLRHLNDAEYLHRCRKIARRLRYLAEFAAPFGGSAMREVAVVLHPLTTALGRLRDIDLAVRPHGRVKRARAEISRKRSIAQIRAAWKRVAGRGGRRLLRQSIAGMEGG